MKKIITVIGARPQFIKASVVSKELRKYFNEIIIHTGQHYDKNMSDVFFEQLKIPKPDYNLGIGGGSHAYQTGNMLIETEKILLKEKPDYVLVYGDTNSTLDHISKILFASIDEAVRNLEKEGITENVYNVGDVMCDSVLYFSKMTEKNFDLNLIPLYERKKLRKWYLTTIHRAENTEDDKNLREILKALNELDELVIFPVHPRIRKMIDNLKEENNYSNIYFIEPVDYLTMLYLTKNSKKVITDSGGLQKECYILDVPCITVRDQTEWIETLKRGYNILSKPVYEELKDKIENSKIIDNNKINYYGDGNTSKRIVDIILKKYR